LPFVFPFSLSSPFHFSLAYLHPPSHFSISGTRPTRVSISGARPTRVRYHTPDRHVYRYHIPDRHMYRYQVPDWPCTDIIPDWPCTDIMPDWQCTDIRHQTDTHTGIRHKTDTCTDITYQWYIFQNFPYLDGCCRILTQISVSQFHVIYIVHFLTFSISTKKMH
jgi:hypothetical protein